MSNKKLLRILSTLVVTILVGLSVVMFVNNPSEEEGQVNIDQTISDVQSSIDEDIENDFDSNSLSDENLGIIESTDEESNTETETDSSDIPEDESSEDVDLDKIGDEINQLIDDLDEFNDITDSEIGL